jgi:hypothetical protein
MLNFCKHGRASTQRQKRKEMRYPYVLTLAVLLCVLFSGCGSSGSRDLSAGGQGSAQSANRTVSFRFVRAQGSAVPFNIDGFQAVSFGPTNNGLGGELSTEDGPFAEEIQIAVPSDASSTKLTLLAGDNPLLQQLFPLPPGSAPVVFDGPVLNPVFEAGGVNSVGFQSQSSPFEVGEERQLVVVTEDGRVVRGGTFESSDPNSLSIDERGVARALRANPQVTINFTIELPEMDLAVASQADGIVTLYDSRNMELGPLTQFQPFPGTFEEIKPVVADFDGDGNQEVGCFKPSGDFRLFESDGTFLHRGSFGGVLLGTDSADFDGDGVDDIAGLVGSEIQLISADDTPIGRFGVPATFVPLGDIGSQVPPSSFVPQVDLFAIEYTNRDGGAGSSEIGVAFDDFAERFDVQGQSQGSIRFEPLRENLGGQSRGISSFEVDGVPVIIHRAGDLIAGIGVDFYFLLPDGSRRILSTSSNVGDAVPVSGDLESENQPFEELTLLALTGDGAGLVEVGPQGDLGATYTPSFGGRPGLRLDRAFSEFSRRTLTAQTTIEVVETEDGSGSPANPVEPLDPLIGDFLARWAELISNESSQVRDFYEPDYSYNGQTADDLSTFSPGFDLRTAVQDITFIDSAGDVITVRLQSTLDVTSSQPPLQRTSDRTLEMRLVRQPIGSDPPFEIRSQRVVEETTEEIPVFSSSIPPSAPLLDISFVVVGGDGRPDATLSANQSYTAQADVSELLPTSNTSFSSVVFHLADQDLVMREQSSGRFTVNFTVPPLTPGLYAPSVTAQNRVFEQPNDFQSSAASSHSRSLELEVR